MVAVNVVTFWFLILVVSHDSEGESLGFHTFQDGGISPVFTSWGASGCMECGRLSPARLEYSNYRRLACTVWLVDHGLNYSPPGIYEPVEDEEKKEEVEVEQEEEEEGGTKT